MIPADRKKLGRVGMTAAEAQHRYVTRTERHIHDQFTSFCRRNGIEPIHSNPVRKSSTRSGLPDFICWKDRAIGIEFKIAGNDLSPIQRKVINEQLAKGNTVYVVTETEPGSAYKEATRIVKEFFGLVEAE